MADTPLLHIHPDPTALARAVAARWLAIAEQAIAARGAFHVALAGGTTPMTLYALLGSPAYRDHATWKATHVYFGDERCVPPDHPDSNYRMARQTLLDHVPVPATQVHRIEAEREDREAAAQGYERVLRARLPRDDGDGAPRFDLVLLGLGPDGHIASLFPGTPALQERERWVVAVYAGRLGVWRISLTFPALNSSRHLYLLAAGESKAEIVRSVLGSPRGGALRYPVDGLAPGGTFEWHLDRAAARLLPEASRVEA